MANWGNIKKKKYRENISSTDKLIQAAGKKNASPGTLSERYRIIAAPPRNTKNIQYFLAFTAGQMRAKVLKVPLKYIKKNKWWELKTFL